ncbi:MAG: hypothetical protein PHC85_00895 [Candidatus Pacebacteria bacterium]|nr:hypothetical protein [Candidatus Paceibacterota bacterium]
MNFEKMPKPVPGYLEQLKQGRKVVLMEEEKKKILEKKGAEALKEEEKRMKTAQARVNDPETRKAYGMK